MVTAALKPRRGSSCSSLISDSGVVPSATLTGGGPATDRDREDSGKLLDSWVFTGMVSSGAEVG